MFKESNMIKHLFYWLFLLTVGGSLFASNQVQTIVLTAPCTNLSFVAGDEYATTLVGNPWNMKQIRDIPYDLNFQEPTVTNNEWSSTFLTAGAAFYPLWRGFSTATVTSYPFYSDGCMPLGMINPIDTAQYSRISMRISTENRSSVWVVWTTNANQVEYAPNGSVGFIDGDYLGLDASGNPQSEMYADGYRIYDFGFTLQEFFADRVQEPCQGVEMAGSWSGKIYGFLVHPTLYGTAGTSIKINWLRLYNPATSPKLQLTWNTTGVLTNDSWTNSVQVWVDTDNSGYDGELFATCLQNDGLYELNTAALAPGDYYFYLKLVNRSSHTAWMELARSAYSALVTITHPPSLEFTAPTHTSGDDYATVELGNPWDMTDSSDIYEPLYLSNISFQNGVMTATADAPILPATESDAQFYLNTKLNGQFKPIDASKYRYLTFRIMVDRTGYTNINDWVARGWLSRAVWLNEGINIDGSEAQGIPLFENWHSYTVDLADRDLLTTENPYPAQLGWLELGSVKRLRFDPLEVFQATGFGVEDVKLCADNRSANNSYTISWVAADPDSASLNVSLYYGSLSGNNFIGTPITTVSQSPGAASYVWDASAVRAGSYYIQAVVSDGTNSFTRTSLVPVIVGGTASGCFTLTNAFALAADFDGDGLADPALYQDSTGNWQTKLSTGNYTLIDLVGFFGGTGWTAMAADFDGDGLADPAVYLPAVPSAQPMQAGQSATTSAGAGQGGGWQIKLSGSGYTTLNLPAFLGGTGWTALAADFDGDGLADPAVYQSASGGWQIKLSGSGYTTLNLPAFLGGTGWTALAADFDGDGLADPAVYQESTGNWQVKLSGSGYADVVKTGYLGGAGYMALAADFDGDALADYAVYQAATWAWKIRLSTGGYVIVSLTL